MHVRRLVIVVLAMVMVGTTGCSQGHSSTVSATAGTTVQRQVPAAVAGLHFTDGAGHAVSLQSLRGRTVLLTDFLSLCQEVCPLTAANIGRVQRAVAKAGAAQDVALVEVTVDPVRDTAARLAAYSKIVGAQGNWSLLTGSAADVAALWRWFGVAYERQPEPTPPGVDWWTGKPLTYDVGHSDVLFFLDDKGVERHLISGNPDATAAQLPTPLASFLDEDGRSNLASPSAGAWTSADVESVLGGLLGKRITDG